MCLGDLMTYIWLAIVILLIIVELMTIHLTTIWFVTSAMVSLILTFFIDSFTIQFIVFMVLGIILLITTRPTLLKLLAKYRQKKGIKHLIGMRGQVISAISDNQIGEVKVDGQLWLATAEVDLENGSYVTVMEVNDNIIKVSSDK